ncbi:hypothetical protein [Paenibacillus bouchesdurhonensis]|uniref:hypothetical protein n=1 Tax=Paenibacillus bouchesdurhonensis TaxID=1870990 RepID=UPI000DA6040B|nr:hypothetical protein [Paenibacillus bouchesdurhonensis]
MTNEEKMHAETAAAQLNIALNYLQRARQTLRASKHPALRDALREVRAASLEIEEIRDDLLKGD